MYLKYLDYFIELAQYDSLNQAAKQLYISRPALSAMIASLEKELNFPLIERSVKGFKLTEAGQDVLEGAKTIQAIIASWQKHAKIDENYTETVTLASLPYACSSLILKLFSTLSERYPFITLSSRTIARDQIDTALTTGKTRLIIFADLPINEAALLEKFQANKLFQINKIFSDQKLLTFSTESDLARKDKIYLKDIQHRTYIHLSDENLQMANYRLYIENLLHPQNYLYAPNKEAIFHLLGQTPQAIIVYNANMGYLHHDPNVINNHLELRQIEDATIALNHYLICPHDHLLTLGEQKVKETLYDICQTL